MKKAFIILLFVFTISQDETLIKEKFEEFIQKYEKTYQDTSEKEKRYEIFKENYIQRKRQGKKIGFTKFSDITFDEFKSQYLGGGNNFVPKKIVNSQYAKDFSAKKTNDNFSLFGSASTTSISTSFDWRSKGIISPVKNQKKCGSCWAFALNALLESLYLMATKNSIDLSEQYLVDCVDDNENICTHGYTVYGAIELLLKEKCHLLEKNYPYINGRNKQRIKN